MLRSLGCASYTLAASRASTRLGTCSWILSFYAAQLYSCPQHHPHGLTCHFFFLMNGLYLFIGVVHSNIKQRVQRPRHTSPQPLHTNVVQLVELTDTDTSPEVRTYVRVRSRRCPFCGPDKCVMTHTYLHSSAQNGFAA